MTRTVPRRHRHDQHPADRERAAAPRHATRPYDIVKEFVIAFLAVAV